MPFFYRLQLSQICPIMKDNTQDWRIKAILHEADALLIATAKMVSMISAVRETPDSPELLDNAVLDTASYCQRVCGFINELHYQLDVNDNND